MKFCKDCKHCQYGSTLTGLKFMCKHPRFIVIHTNLVTGSSQITYNYRQCEQERLNGPGDTCSKSGVYFESNN